MLFHSILPRPHFFLAALPWLAVGMMTLELLISSGVKASTFLPDDAEIACRAILPQCFKRSDWAQLCAKDANVAEGHPEACRAAGVVNGQTPQGR